MLCLEDCPVYGFGLDPRLNVIDESVASSCCFVHASPVPSFPLSIASVAFLRCGPLVHCADSATDDGIAVTTNNET